MPAPNEQLMKRSPSGVAIQFTFTEWGLNQMLIWTWHSGTSFAKLQSATSSSCASPSRTSPGVVSQGQVVVQTTPPAIHHERERGRDAQKDLLDGLRRSAASPWLYTHATHLQILSKPARVAALSPSRTARRRIERAIGPPWGSNGTAAFYSLRALTCCAANVMPASRWQTRRSCSVSVEGDGSWLLIYKDAAREEPGRLSQWADHMASASPNIISWTLKLRLISTSPKSVTNSTFRSSNVIGIVSQKGKLEDEGLAIHQKWLHILGRYRISIFALQSRSLEHRLSVQPLAKLPRNSRDGDDIQRFLLDEKRPLLGRDRSANARLGPH